MDYLSATANPTGLRIFFGVLFLLVVSAGIYLLRHRQKFFTHQGDESDSYASANLRIWLVILVWPHAAVITALMIFKV